MSPPDSVSVSVCDSQSMCGDFSDIGQLDGNVTNTSDSSQSSKKPDKISAAVNLPTVATYNCRSLFPKVESLKTDLMERQIDLGFLTEIWEQKQNIEHKFEIEKMLEMSGLQYFSTARPPNRMGVSYGGAAIVVNVEKFACEKLQIPNPSNLEVVWGLLKSKNPSARFKKIIICSFYSPPSKKRNTKMADHIVSTLQMLSSRYPDCGVIIGADKNSMDIRPILSCGLRLRQVVDLSTRQGEVLDIIIMNLSSYYKSPIIAPPLQPDDPKKAKPSDHSVPVCAPHTDRYKPAARNYRIIKYRPMPESSVHRFGEWIVNENWDSINSEMSANQQSVTFEQLVSEKLNSFCPVKEMKLGSQDKPFITAELKRIARLKNREYNKRGKTKKYKKLESLFQSKYKMESEKYLNKNMDALRDTNPGQAYAILKRMGAMPGDCIDANTFSLPSHERDNLSDEQCAERIAEHFALISSEFPPLDVSSLPPRVQTKLQCTDSPPVVSDYDVYRKIRAAKKPKSGVPNDLPRSIVQEFAPELSKPAARIINKICSTGTWPDQWKLEHIVPAGKIPMPESEDDLRPISLTSFFSKITEHFVVMWLMEIIKDKIDFRQYGGLKGNSITHYLIEFINFILSCQDSTDQTAILAVMVDFSKAFNRQNHNLLITKLSDMGVPSWLLQIVIAFLSDRKMRVRYKGKQSSVKSLPGGGPQGTLLGLLLFIVLINDVGFDDQVNNAGEIITSKRNMKTVNQIHLKYVDDLTMAEAIDLPTNLVSIPDSERAQPDLYHARTGHVLPVEKSNVYKELVRTMEYADTNEMKINYKKTKAMVFNPCTSIDFSPELTLQNNDLEVVDEIRLLGIIIRSDLKTVSNTENMVKKANKRLWIVRRLKHLGAQQDDLLDVYTKQVRSVLELAVPAWHGTITLTEQQDIERIQKSVAHIILGDEYVSYKQALLTLNLESLQSRRGKLCLNFAKKAEKHDKFKNWFKVSEAKPNTRQPTFKYQEVNAKHKRFKKSPLGLLTTMLNEHYSKK